MDNNFRRINIIETYPRKSETKGRVITAAIITFVLLIVLALFNNFLNKGSLISPLITSAKNRQANIELKNVVTKSLEGTKGRYAVYIKNLKTGEEYSQNAYQSFDSGSLYKLWVMATIYKQIQEGVLKEDESISESVESLNREFGLTSEVAELQSGYMNFTVKSALNQMITISHNYAALMLSKKAKLSNVSEFLKDNNFAQSSLGGNSGAPKTSAADTTNFFEKLYKGELADEENTKKMIDLLKGQKLNSKLPKNLPADTVVAHKTGEIGRFSHDGGIVYSEKGDYIIVVLSESDIPAAANDRIADLSKAVFDHFQKD